MINISNTHKEAYFNYLLNSVYRCDLCPRMCGRKKVLSSANGNLNSKVLFVAEAPGRLGAECTGIPLYGDKAGDNFEVLLSNVGWQRSDIFITNAVLCNPQNEDGNNATPNKDEMINCNYYLKMTLELVNPEVIVTIGAKALEAVSLISAHNITLKKDVAVLQDWNGIKLFPIYHTGSRALVHRSQIKQRSDFIALSNLVDPNTGLKKRKKTSNSTPRQVTPMLIDMVAVILNNLKELSFFKLTKLLYLIDLSYFEQSGYTMSGSIYLRMQEGPWLPYLKDISKDYNGILFFTKFVGRKPFLSSCINSYNPENLEEEELAFITDMCQKYKDYDDTYMKIAVYRTKPMKYILEQEKRGRQMTKIPVLYKDRTVIEMDTLPF